MNKKLALIMILVWIATGITCYIAGCNHSKQKVESTHIDTVYYPHTIKDTVAVPKFYTLPGKRVIDSFFVKVYTDSLYKLLRDSLSYSFVAEKDTTYLDANLTANVSFISPIPLHPNSYFNLNFRYLEKQITKTEVVSPGFWSKLLDRFGIFLGANMGLDMGGKIVPNLGVGFGVKIFP